MYYYKQLNKIQFISSHMDAWDPYQSLLVLTWLVLAGERTSSG